MNYQEYTSVDFAADASFIKWVRKPASAAAIFWDTWLLENPHKKEEIQEARKMVLYLLQDKDELQDWELNQIWANLQQSGPGNPKHNKSAIKILFSKSALKKYLTTAFVIGVLILCAGLVYLSGLRAKVTYATDYGQKRTLVLPDGSNIILNAHSTVSFPKYWFLHDTRQIKLSGEAYFNVRHTPDHQKFVVETIDGLQVEVLGTEFNVSDRGQKSQVVLVTGKVRLRKEQNQLFKPAIMAPGELAEVSKTTASLEKKKINPAFYIAWKDNKLNLDNTSLREVATLLEQNYGKRVRFSNQSLADLKITASLNTGNLNDLLLTLSETFNLKIIRRQQEILISN